MPFFCKTRKTVKKNLTDAFICYKIYNLNVGGSFVNRKANLFFYTSIKKEASDEKNNDGVSHDVFYFGRSGVCRKR